MAAVAGAKVRVRGVGACGRTATSKLAGFCAFLLLAFSAAHSAAVAEPRVALVIGNAKYSGNPLRNPRRDAELMARTLAAVGFDVLPVLDGGAAEMRKAVTEFSRRLQVPGSVALFYYAGHGVQADGENYLIPLGADIKSMNEVALNALSLGDVLRAMARSEARMNIVILDACRDNPFSATTRSIASGGLAPVVAPSGTIIGYATAPGEVARDGDGQNSPYTAALAANIPAAGLTLEDVFRATRRRVLDVTGGKQTPWEHSSLVGEFFFKPKTAEPEGSGRPPPADPQTAARLSEIDAWEKVKDSKDPQVLKDHIQHYPDGVFAELAAYKASRLEAMHTQTPWTWIMTGSNDRDGGGPEAAATYEKALKLEANAGAGGDLGEAAKLYGEAAAQGLAAAMFSYARAFDKGRGVPKNLVEAARWYGQAADKDHAGARAALGTMYEFGEGVKPDLAEALRLYRLAADAGDPAGLTSLGYLFAQGKGVATNAVEARRLYSLAADKGHARAMFNLALLDMSGPGGPINLANAVKLLTLASGKGHAGAAQELAYLYDEGRGVARNPVLAAEHLLAAQRYAHRDGRKIDVVSRAWSFATRREFQKQLAAKKLYKGIAHGFFNDATRKALVAAAEM